jgi:hypothetical protein
MLPSTEDSAKLTPTRERRASRYVPSGPSTARRAPADSMAAPNLVRLEVSVQATPSNTTVAARWLHGIPTRRETAMLLSTQKSWPQDSADLWSPSRKSITRTESAATTGRESRAMGPRHATTWESRQRPDRCGGEGAQSISARTSFCLRVGSERNRNGKAADYRFGPSLLDLP